MGYKTIFHIDDDDDDIDFFATAVNQLSAAVSYFSFTNAGEALQKLVTGETPPDVIFLDLNMPVINGQEFLLRLKTIESLQDIPVIILSSSSDPYTIEQLKTQGAIDFLTKPSGIKELINLLRPYLI
ncbi:response regulator [Flavobacterium sp. C3NV]|jgi:CheY-like chemotaxis protein|uniref:response regulator n=1 Tax=Flavobacterium sp. C3NV TaxID=3393358 RepID=UPI00398FFBDC